ncbi:hypothetical protein PVAP13_7KG398501 [Panicum virgatum]|uniref:Uncharacterized protein n=1 Tax=Panicum virgatum TaxID=38727 RepID=A0A8T0QC63_PANVG|nr:hypothetical protein PVAP13_7KG398501 [Panicum virgatum]
MAVRGARGRGGSGPQQREELGAAAEDVRRRWRTTARVRGGGSSPGFARPGASPWRREELGAMGREELGAAVALDGSNARSSGPRRRGESAAAQGDGLSFAAA